MPLPVSAQPVEPQVPAPKKSLLDKAEQFYLKKISSLVQFFFRHDCVFAGGALGALLAEPLETIRVSYHAILGSLFGLNFHNVNPEKLTARQASETPVLLIHGNYHDPSAWMNLAKELQKANSNRPIFTVKINVGEFDEKDQELVNIRIEEIKSLYKEAKAPFDKIDLVGHSRGATTAFLAGFEEVWKVPKTKEDEKALEAKGYFWIQDEQGKIFFKKKLTKRSDIGKVIMLGNPLTKMQRNAALEKSQDLYEIAGKLDVISTKPTKEGTYVPAKPLDEVEKSQKLEVKTGHLGLLSSKKVLRTVINWLKPD